MVNLGNIEHELTLWRSYGQRTAGSVQVGLFLSLRLRAGNNHQKLLFPYWEHAK